MGVQDRDWYWRRETPANGYIQPKRSFFKSFPVQIAMGVAAGIVFAAAVVLAFNEWRTRAAAEEAARVFQQLATEQQRRQAAQAEAAARANAQREAVARERRQAIANQQRTVENWKRSELDARNRKEKAWERFYRKPPRCDEALGGSWTVDCANEYIRAKRAFQERYDAGKL